jgi:hypothetical protein
MKTSKIIISCLSFLFILAFSKESFSPEVLGSAKYTKTEYPVEAIIDGKSANEATLKNTLYTYLHEALQHKGFRDFLVMNLYHDKLKKEEDQHPECIIAKTLAFDFQIDTEDGFDLARSSTCTLEDIMMQWVALYNPEKMELFNKLHQHFPDLAIQSAWWSPSVNNSESINEQNGNTKADQSYFHEDQKEMTHQKRVLNNFILIWLVHEKPC